LLRWCQTIALQPQIPCNIAVVEGRGAGMSDAERTPEAANAVFAARVVTGLLQGLALYLLYLSTDHKVWPATDGYAFAPLLFISLFAPLVAVTGLGNLRSATLLMWTASVVVLTGAVAWYGIWRAPFTWNATPRIAPDPFLFFLTFGWLFIAHALIAGGDQDRRFIADHRTHFDVAWKLGLQALLCGVFVGVLWGVLYLGAALFNLIGIDAIQKLIEHRWFAIPATTLALSVAVHLTDVRAGLVRGTRTLVLVLLSWLLPLMVAIAAGFLASLSFTGLAPLWKTGFAAGYLLTAAGALVFLINATRQDGDPEHAPQAVLRLSGSLAALLLVPLVAISAYAIYLRVEQYGWTAGRVTSTACLVVAATYAAGYAFAALPFGPWLARISQWNFVCALVVLVVVAALVSPVADPARLSVDSQVARLLAGRIDARKFDFDYLRWRAGRFGTDALAHLALVHKSAMAAYINAKAHAAIAADTGVVMPPVAADIATNVAVYPKGRSLPASFLHQNWSKADPIGNVPACLTTADVLCEAYFLPVANDGQEEIVILGVDRSDVTTSSNAVITQDVDGRWRVIGVPDSYWTCKSVIARLRNGDWRIADPVSPRWRDLSAAGVRLTIRSTVADEASCPK
jgi:hypothetical protein